MQDTVFKLSAEMEAELNEQLAQATADGKESYDSVGTRPRSSSLRRRLDTGGNSQSLEPVPQDHPPVIAEDPINPSHYRKHASGIECIEVTRHMNFNVGNAVKYLWRYMDKGDPIENLKKAQWYLEDEIKRLTR